EALAALEGAERVALYPSGLAAMTGALLALLKAGDEVLLVDCAYRPTKRFCDNVLARFGVTTRLYDPKLDAAGVAALIGERTRAVILESPGSLSFEIQDVPGIAALCRERGVLTLMDNTYGAGLLFKPLAHGVDVSCQALTKYICGHADVFLGSAATRDPKLGKTLELAGHDIGWSVSPDDAYQALRGLRTLETRLKQHEASALTVASWLKSQSQVARVLHPALPGAPGHELWKRDFSGANGLFAFELTPASQKTVEALLDALEVFGLGFSWGGFESLAIHCDPQFSNRKFKPDLAGPLVRLHIGLESPDDLIADLARGLAVYADA
ncbi:MAG: cystathionine beta-lyase, partial [Caulobacterales bacterium]|nr:cystathionine beta-lyase [Caulobacterales bacterium]